MSSWYTGGNPTATTGSKYTGNYGMNNPGGWNSAFQNITVAANTTYTLSVRARLSGSLSGNNYALYYSLNGGTTKTYAYITSTNWTQLTLTINTGASTTVQIGSICTTGTNIAAYFDDFSLSTGGSSSSSSSSSTTSSTSSSSSSSGSNCNRIRFYPRDGNAARMVNGRFTGNNQGPTNAGFVLHTVTTTPANGQWVDVTFTNPTVYRYLKYEAPNGSWGNIAEVEFYNGNTKLSGTQFGTSGANPANPSATFDKALDGNTATFFDASSADSQYLGIDLGANVICSTPTFSPAPGNYASTQSVSITTATSGATIRYTTNGANPSPTSGTVYSSPITVSSTTTIRAIAYRSGLGDSTIASGTYTIGSPPPTGSVNTIYHLGNSLTDNIWYNSLQPMIQSTGRTYTYGRHIIPGAPLGWIWDNPTSGFEQAPFGYYPQALPGYHWDAVTFQPFDRQIGDDTTSIKQFIDLARQRADNSSTQFYIYAHWPRKNSDGTLNYNFQWDKPYTGGWDGTNETRDFYEDLMFSVRAATPYLNKPILIIPVGDVMYEFNIRAQAGQIPGFTSVNQLYSDGIHLNNVGAFLVASTFYATIYKADPRYISYSSYDVISGSGDRDITDAMARAIQDCVWAVVQGHPFSGVE